MSTKVSKGSWQATSYTRTVVRGDRTLHQRVTCSGGSSWSADASCDGQFAYHVGGLGWTLEDAYEASEREGARFWDRLAKKDVR